MSEVKFFHDDLGRYKAITLRRVPTETTTLTSLQKVLKSPQIKLYPEPRLHMTEYHFGHPEMLLDEIKEHNPLLPIDEVAKGLTNLITQIKNIKNKPVDGIGDSLDVFSNASRHFLVLKLKLTSEIMEGRCEIEERIKEFLKEVGVSDLEAYADKSRMFGFHLKGKYWPHVSLGQVFGRDYAKDWDVSNVKFNLSRRLFCNVKFV